MVQQWMTKGLIPFVLTAAPAKILAFDKKFGIDQAQAVDEFLECSCWGGRDLPHLVGNNRTARERLAALRRVLRAAGTKGEGNQLTTLEAGHGSRTLDKGERGRRSPRRSGVASLRETLIRSQNMLNKCARTLAALETVDAELNRNRAVRPRHPAPRGWSPAGPRATPYLSWSVIIERAAKTLLGNDVIARRRLLSR